MSTDALAITGQLSQFEQLRYGRQIVLLESKALEKIATRLDGEFCRAVKYLSECRGNVIVTGIGKAGLIGRKIMATLASTGTASHFLHPAEAVHGDLGRIRRDDLMLVLSQSGETEEIVRLLPALAELGAPILAITGNAASRLGRAATVVIDLGPLEEACALGLAPSTSTTAMLAVGDALALVTSRQRNFGRDDFARLHPGGSLGNKLSKVEQHFRPLEQCRVANEVQSVREMLVSVSKPGRRSGATMLVDRQGILTGIFTDSDLARLFEHHRDGELDGPVSRVMTHNPLCVPAGSMMSDAVAIIAERKISELPVIDADGRPLGLIDITDVVALLPKEDVPDNSDLPRPQKHPSLTIISPLRVIREPEAGDEA